MRRLYPTEKAAQAVKQIGKIHSNFYQTLCAGIFEEDIRLTEQTLEWMMENVNQKVWHRMDKKGKAQSGKQKTL